MGLVTRSKTCLERVSAFWKNAHACVARSVQTSLCEVMLLAPRRAPRHLVDV